MEASKIILIIMMMASPAFANEVEVSAGIHMSNLKTDLGASSENFSSLEILGKRQIATNTGILIGYNHHYNQSSISNYNVFIGSFYHHSVNRFFNVEPFFSVGFSFYEEKTNSFSLKENWGLYFSVGVKNYIKINKNFSSFISFSYKDISLSKTSLSGYSSSFGLSYSF